MIVSVTLNPALRVDYEAAQVRAGESNRIRRVGLRAAGRGLAVARILHTFGHEVVAAGLAGGAAGELIRNELARAGVPAQLTAIAAETRRVLMITDSSSGTTTSFAEPAPYVTTEELGRLAADYRALLAGATAVVLCGSLPEALPAEIYGSFVSYATGADVPVILDAAGSALQHGAARGPALVIPGDQPVPSLAGGQSAMAVSRRGGVRVTTAGGGWDAVLAAGPAMSRDGMVAGLVPGIALGWSWPDTLRHAVALAASIRSDGEADLVGYEKLMPAVRVSRCTAAGPT